MRFPGRPAPEEVQAPQRMRPPCNVAPQRHGDPGRVPLDWISRVLCAPVARCFSRPLPGIGTMMILASLV